MTPHAARGATGRPPHEGDPHSRAQAMLHAPLCWQGGALPPTARHGYVSSHASRLYKAEG